MNLMRSEISCDANFLAVADVLEYAGALRLQQGAEVGVRSGRFSEHLLFRFPQLRMFLVDDYLPYQDVDGWVGEQQQAEYYAAAVDRLSQFGDRAIWLRERSHLAAGRIPCATLDFAFIDANHSYECAMSDIACWALTVRPGGILCGHDYTMHPVCRAVVTFARTYGLSLECAPLPADVWFMEIK